MQVHFGFLHPSGLRKPVTLHTAAIPQSGKISLLRRAVKYVAAHFKMQKIQYGRAVGNDISKGVFKAVCGD